jgi:hypothetical protein
LPGSGGGCEWSVASSFTSKLAFSGPHAGGWFAGWFCANAETENIRMIKAAFTRFSLH